jgi:hypothetical protein
MSTLKVNTIQNASGVEVYTAKAWVNFDGTGTVAIRAAGNVTSITDNGTGIYTLNFTNALSDANYVVLSMASSVTGQSPPTMHQFQDTSATTSAVKIYADRAGIGQVDPPNIYAAVFR